MSVRDIVAKHRPAEMSRSGQMRFAQYVRAVQDPNALLSDLERGVVEPEVLETWQALYPEELEEVRQMLTSEISTAAAAGHEFPEARLRMFDEVLGTPDLGYTALLQGNYQQQREAKMASRASQQPPMGAQLPTGIDTALKRYEEG